ncbi:MAG TPA: DUF362 domain-containing protein, partial [Isosphaeraceae bacterium]|nr:DUF362 domain-containing protein [Isosphaeraceae bacterium]
RVTVAEGATDATEGFRRFGLDRIAWNRPVRFFDINRDETEWDSMELRAVDGSPLSARVSRTIVDAPCRVSLALMKTHVTSMVTFSIKNMLSSIHPSDRVMMHGHAGGGNGYTGVKRLVVEFLKQDNPLVRGLTRGLGAVRTVQHSLHGKRGPDGWRRLSGPDLGFLKSAEAMNHNLVRLARKTGPHVSVVDGFVAMHGEGPRHGTPVKLGVVVAGTNPVAVDAVSASVMGFDPQSIGYLSYANTAGLGPIDLDEIHVVGDALGMVSRRLRPHSNHAIARHWTHLAEGVIPAPHVRPARLTTKAGKR